MRFDVRSDGRSLTNLLFSSVNESCQPPNITSISGGGDYGTQVLSISSDGTFANNAADQIAVFVGGKTYAANATLQVMGRFTGATAAGTTTNTVAFNYLGINVTCSSGTVTWTAVKTS